MKPATTTRRTGNWDEVADVATAADALYLAMRRQRNIPDDSPEPLSVAQMTLLEPLLDEPELTVGQLAVRADVSVPTATRMLKNLQARGVIERYRSDRDDRKVLVRLSPAGSQIAASRRDRLRRRQVAHLSRLSVRERADMARQLKKLTLLITSADDA